MPVVTRSCAKERRRPLLEQETPVTATMARSRRYETRSPAKRKILHKDQDRENVGPSSKRAAYTRTSKKKSNNPSIQERNNASTNQNNRVVTTKASKCAPRKNVRRNTFKDSNTASLLSNTGCMGNEDDCIIHQAIETSVSPLNDTVVDDCAKTPANCIAARIRSYSALRQSQWRKNNIGRSVNSVANARSPLEEISFNPKVMEIESDDDEDVLWKMSQQSSSEGKDDVDEPISDDLESYKEKYLTLITSMKQLQNTFLRAQQNAEKNMKAYDRFVNELKSTLSQEKQKTSLLNEELKIKKGVVERLRCDLANAKEHVECLKQEKMDVEKHNMEKSEKEMTSSSGTLGGFENEESLLMQKKLEDQKHVINFYSKLSGISILSDKNCEDSSSFQSFNCAFYPDANTGHCLQFRLTHDKEFDEIEYSPNPRSPSSEDVLLNFPKYLRENIFFGAEEASRFLATLITATKK